VIGITLRTIFPDSLPAGLSTVFFLIMGWASAFSVIVVWRRHGPALIWPLFWGGMAYTVGAVLLELHWPVIVPGIIGPHELWHIAVLVGLGLRWRFAFQIAGGAPWKVAAPEWLDAYQGTGYVGRE
jgi:channel protein (hemolysin III family)